MLAVVSHFAFCYFNMSGFNPLDNLLFNATSIAWPLLWMMAIISLYAVAFFIFTALLTAWFIWPAGWQCRCWRCITDNGDG